MKLYAQVFMFICTKYINTGRRKGKKNSKMQVNYIKHVVKVKVHKL